MSTHIVCLYGEIRNYYLDITLTENGAKNKYLEEGLIKSEYIFYKSIINRWLVGFTKPMIDYEILADSQH